MAKVLKAPKLPGAAAGWQGVPAAARQALVLAAVAAAAVAGTLFFERAGGLHGMRNMGTYAHQRTRHAITAAAGWRPGGGGSGGNSTGGRLSGDKRVPSGDGRLHGSIYTDRPGCGDYCSYGKVGVWSGDIATNEALREMLKAVSYKNEIILVLSGNLRHGLNTVRSITDLGLTHLFILAHVQATCNALPAAFEKNTSCVWDTTPQVPEMFADRRGYGAHARRWMVAARIVRMGYNLLSLDDDIMLHHSIYNFLKLPELANITLWASTEADSLLMHPTMHINCGVMYWNGADPSGPAAWGVGMLADYLMRIWEASAWLQTTFPPGVEIWDQRLWNDMLLSVWVGRPIALGLLLPHKESTSTDQAAAWKALHQELYQAPRDVTLRHVTIPEELVMATAVREDNVTTLTGLRLPAAGGEWPDKLGGRVLPKERGNWSANYWELLKSASSAPMWPDLDDPPPPERTDEIFGFMPHWMAGASLQRAHGFWQHDPPAQVVAHMRGGGFLQRYWWRGFGWWHWEVEDLFDSASVDGEQGATRPPLSPSPKLLALAPGVWWNTTTLDEYHRASRQLFKLAAMLNRTLVLPTSSCESQWLEKWPWPMLGFPDYYDRQVVKPLPFYPRGEESRPMSNRGGAVGLGLGSTAYCQPNGYDAYLEGPKYPCFGRVIPFNMLSRFLDPILPSAQRAPTKNNTLFWTEYQAAKAIPVQTVAPLQPWYPMEEQQLPTAAEFLKAAAAFDAEPLLWVGAPPRVADASSFAPLPAWFAEYQATCPWAQDK